jgi:hypothetical protein
MTIPLRGKSTKRYNERVIQLSFALQGFSPIIGQLNSSWMVRSY